MSQTIYIVREYQIGYNDRGDTILATTEESVALAEVVDRYGKIDKSKDYNGNTVYKSGDDLCDPYVVVETIELR